MKTRTHHSSILIAVGVELALATGIISLCAVLILNGVLPQRADHICAAAAISIATFVCVKLCIRRAPEKKYLTALCAALAHLGILCLLNPVWQQSNFDALAINAACILVCCALALLQPRSKRGKYKIRY